MPRLNKNFITTDISNENVKYTINHYHNLLLVVFNVISINYNKLYNKKKIMIIIIKL